MNLLSIGEVANRTGVRPSALRYYEQAGILPAATRIHGRRHYDTELVRMVEVLRFAQKAGFTLEEIKTLLRGSDRDTAMGIRWRSLAKSKLEELDALVANAAYMRRAIEIGLQCGCVRLADCTLPEISPPARAAKHRRRSARNVRS